jgi:hypothetical protein
MVLAGGTSVYSYAATDTVKIDGVGTDLANCDVNGAVYTGQTAIHMRDNNFSAGTIACVLTTTAPSFNTSNFRVELQAVAGTTRRRIHIT